MKKFLTFFAAAAALVACNKTADTTQAPGSREVKFTVSNLYSVTTKADAIADGKFVAIYAGAPIGSDNVKMTVNMENSAVGTLTPTVTNSLLWAVGQTTQETKFLAVYPYETTRPLVGDDEATKYIEYSIANEAESVEYADHFLSAATSQAPGTGDSPATVELGFKHPFAKLVYTIDNQSDDFVRGVSISGIRQTGHVMFTSGAAVATGTAIAVDDAVSLNAIDANSWYTIAMPETEAVNPRVTVEMVSGTKYTFRLGEDIALAAGKKYTADIEITGTHGETVSDRTVTGTFTVTDWDVVDTGDLNPDGQELASKWWYLSGNVNKVNETTDTNWGGIIPFRCTGVDQWEIEFYYCGGTDENSNGFKLRYATGVADWDEAWGMTPGETTYWLIQAATLPVAGTDGVYVVHSLSKNGGKNIRIDTAGKYKIVFHPTQNSFNLYKITD